MSPKTFSIMPLLFLLLILRHDVTEARTFLPGSMPSSFFHRRNKVQPLSTLQGVVFVGGTQPSNDNQAVDSGMYSNWLGARGGHSSQHDFSDVEEDIGMTSTSSSTSSIASETTTTASSTVTIQPGGSIQPLPKKASNVTTIKDSAIAKQQAAKEAKLEAKEAKLEAKEAKREAKQEAKVQKKKEKEERKRHKQIAKKLRNRNAMNKRRKFMHAAWGMLFASLNHFIPTKFFVPGMTILSTGTLLMELLRYREGFEWMNNALHAVLGHALRKHEMDGRFTGSFYYFLGVTVTAALCPKSSATLGICQLAIADPMASYFGKATRHVYWSRIGNGFFGLGRNKGILGFLGGAAACVPLNYRLLSLAKFPDPMAVKSSTIFLASLALGVAGAFADLIVPTPALTLPKKIYGVSMPPFHVDDNCIVPILSGLACEQIFRLCHWPVNLQLATHLIVR